MIFVLTMRRVLITILVTTVVWPAVLFAAPASLPPEEIAELIDAYVGVAFGLEGGGPQVDYIRKWQHEQINVYVLPTDSLVEKGSHAMSVMDTIAGVVKDITLRSKLTGIVSYDSVEMLDVFRNGRLRGFDQMVGSISVFVGTRSDLVQLANVAYPLYPMLTKLVTVVDSQNPDRPLCVTYGASTTDEIGVVSLGIVFVEDGDALLTCSYEEIMQAFGIVNDLPTGSESIFNDDDVIEYPTDRDFLLLRLHSDPRIRPGMSEAEVRSIAPRILQDMVN